MSCTKLDNRRIALDQYLFYLVRVDVVASSHFVNLLDIGEKYDPRSYRRIGPVKPRIFFSYVHVHETWLYIFII